MNSRPSAEQITKAMHRAAWAARQRKRYPDPIAEFPRTDEQLDGTLGRLITALSAEETTSTFLRRTD
jgi:hypothetical protein